MPKPTKSSASSGTRKKHARKSGKNDEGQAPPPKDKRLKGKDKAKAKAEPKKKVYIPPLKPAPVQQDPLDSLGLAKVLPPDLVVVLRRLSKKDAVTKGKALEELMSSWVGRGNDTESILEVAMPVWLHHLPSLFLHPSRRIRLLATSLHVSFLRLTPLRNTLLYDLREISTQDQDESVLGAWSMASRDVDRQVASYARRSWTNCISIPLPSSPETESEPEKPKEQEKPTLSLEGEFVTGLLSFVQRAVMDPAGLYLYLNPVQVAVSHSSHHHHGAGRPNRGRGPVQVKREEREVEVEKKADVDEESEVDRRARLRIGGLGVLQYLIETRTFTTQITPILSSPELWSSLHHASLCPFADSGEDGSFGHGQPVVRTATWNVLAALLTNKGAMENELVELLSVAVLRSAFVEPDPLVRTAMWKPLLLFLKDHPTAWELEAKLDAAQSSPRPDGEHEHDEDEDGSDDEDEAHAEQSTQPPAQPEPQPDAPPHRSKAYSEFLQFLELGCSGSPTQGYPTIVIILSTIPSSILLSSDNADPSSSTSTYPASELFTSFWAAIDGRALSSLDRSTTSAAFLTSLLECLSFIIRRLRSSQQSESDAQVSETHGAVTEMVKDQYKKVWEEVSEGRLKVEEKSFGRIVAEGLQGLEKMDVTLFEDAWQAFTHSISQTSSEPTAESSTASSRLVTTTLKTMYDVFEDGTKAKERVSEMVRGVVTAAAKRCKIVLDETAGDTAEQQRTRALEGLKDVLQVFEGIVWDDKEFSELVDDTMNKHSAHLLLIFPSLLMAYLASRTPSDMPLTLGLWRSILVSLSSAPSIVYGALPALLDAVEKDRAQGTEGKGDGWVVEMHPEEREFDEVLMTLFGEATSGMSEGRSREAVGLLERIIRSSKPFVTPSSFETLFQLLVGSFTQQSTSLLVVDPIPSDSTTTFSDESESDSFPSPTPSSFNQLETLLRLVAASLKVRPDLGEQNPSLLVEAFIVGYLLPKSLDELVGSKMESTAKNVWVARASVKGSEGTVLDGLKAKLADALGDVNVRASPEDILRVASDDIPGIPSSLHSDILPTVHQLDTKLSSLRSTPAHPILAITQSLVPPPSTFSSLTLESGSTSFDSIGFSSYARLVSALLQTFTSDLYKARSNIWALKHFIALAAYAEESIQLPVMESEVFRTGLDKEVLEGLRERVKMMQAYLLVPPNDTAGGSWHAKVVKAALPVAEGKGRTIRSQDGIEELLLSLVEDGKKKDTYRASRVLLEVLKHVLVDAGKADTEQWMMLARRLERGAPQTSLAIVRAIACQGSEPPLLARYRNELAAGILGISPNKANTEGLILLRRLAASAPDPESDVVFLPQPRAVNFMKTCQKWITGNDDEDEDEEGIDDDVQSEMTGVFMDMVPLLQNVPGSHWDLIFDIIENNLENASFEDDETLVVLWRTIRLIQMIQDLVVYNKTLKADWQERQMAVLGLLRDLVAAQPKSAKPSTPRSLCREAALSIVQTLPNSLINQNTLVEMVHLLLDPSLDVQKMAYDLLQEAAKKRTEYLVIEVGVDTESTVKPELPSELISILEMTLDLSDLEDHRDPRVFACLLGWMLAFDLFTDTSMKVRSGYTEQIRNLDLVASNFIPLVLNILNLWNGLGKAFKLDIWSINEHYLSSYDPDDTLSLKLLTAHLYYRALLTIPSLIRSWLHDCKDRNLSASVTNYTSQHFSPVIINTELVQLRIRRVTSELDDENLSIKVATNVNEVTAVYTVDEQHLTITLKVPADWPLHGIEVKDSQRVGVTESRWRGWLLGVQQIVWAQNGHIIDALSLFKKNVSLHFEGQGECAICYSIISVMDGALPNKPCKTCKNRFHSSCLYKWFNTSHSSSCPLCRSDIM